MILAILLFALAGCQTTVKKEIPQAKPVNVKVMYVEEVEYKIPVRATGILSTTREMKLSFKTGGLINQLNIREGATVIKGDVLVALDLSEVRAQATQARIGLDKARRDLTRAGNLYRDSVATLEQFQNAESSYELAVAQKQIVDFNLEHSQIKAPSDGKIQKILVETNEMIAPGYPAILFASTENDWVVRVALTDKDIVKLSIGDSGRISMDAFPGVEFNAEVTELGALADPLTGTYEVELLVQQSMPQFRTGFISRVDIYPAHSSISPVVPINALLDASDNMAYVFIYGEGETEKRQIRTGLILGNQIVVKEGLSNGELVITEGAKYLLRESTVNPVNLEEVTATAHSKIQQQ